MIKIAPLDASDIARFFSAINKTETCWLWVKSKTKQGYGDIGIKGHILYAHRVSWTIHFGEIPEGVHVLHKCDIPACVNPEHLFVGTAKDNSDDKIKKGRYSNGDSRHLTPDQVRGIIKDFSEGMRQCDIGRKYLSGKPVHVREGIIQHILRGLTYKEISGGKKLK